jgi:hypothetical protein
MCSPRSRVSVGRTAASKQTLKSLRIHRRPLRSWTSPRPSIDTKAPSPSFGISVKINVQIPVKRPQMKLASARRGAKRRRTGMFDKPSIMTPRLQIDQNGKHAIALSVNILNRISCACTRCRANHNKCDETRPHCGRSTRHDALERQDRCAGC